MLSIENKVPKLKDFSIYNPTKFKEELILLEKSNIFMLDDKFYQNMENFIMNELRNRFNKSNYFYDYNQSYNPISKFFKKLYSNIQNASLRSIISDIASGAQCYLGITGFHNIFAHNTQKWGYNYGYANGQKDFEEKLIRFSSENNTISNYVHNSLKNFVKRTTIEEPPQQTLYQNLLHFGKGTFMCSLLVGVVRNILNINHIYDENTIKLQESLSFIGKKRECARNFN